MHISLLAGKHSRGATRVPVAVPIPGRGSELVSRGPPFQFHPTIAMVASHRSG